MDIVIPIYDGFTALDAVGPYEVLSRVRRAGAVRGAEAGPVRTDNGMLSVVAEARSTMSRRPTSSSCRAASARAR